jgi:glucosamine kinase
MSVRPVLGLDIGGTWTRALAVDPRSGERLGSGRSAGANPIAHGMNDAADRIRAALGQALAAAGAAPADVLRCVVGMAGTSRLSGDPGMAKAFAELWERTGLRCEVEVVSDVVTAFAAGTAAADGSVLIAGTGAVAASIVHRRQASLYGGHGWLLGDEGSGFWIGRQAVRAALATLDGSASSDGRAATQLAEAVLEAYDLPLVQSPAPALRPEAALIAAVNARPPLDLARLAAVVTAASDRGDARASRILHEAAKHLMALLRRQRGPHDATPIVLSGGVITPPSCVHRLVLDAARDAWPQAPVHLGIDGAAGAAQLAALELGAVKE